MFAGIPSATLVGTTGRPVLVEVHVTGGFGSFTIVGLPDTAVRESRDRVRAALLSSGFAWPQQRITVNLAPSAVRKGGAGLDLPIALGVLVVAKVLQQCHADGIAFIGELGLDGSVRHVPGVLAMAEAAVCSRLVVPADDVAEAALVYPGVLGGVGSLRDLVMLLTGRRRWTDQPAGTWAGSSAGASGSAAAARGADGPDVAEADLADVRGQRVGRRAVEVAAAGGHHLLFVGPPGSGKTMLAQRLPGVLPALCESDALDVARIRSAAGLGVPPGGLVRRVPFRAPHHGASAVSLVGGGTWSMRPGELSLATHGVLFLDEMAEFSAGVLEALREPLEEGVVRVSRAQGTVTFPARFQLVGAMNPCPCGEGALPGACRCTPTSRARYARRLSAPLLDRFDLVVPLGRPDPAELLGAGGEPSASVRERVGAARALAARRGVPSNAAIAPGRLDELAPLSPGARRLLEARVGDGGLSGRGAHRVRRVARTVADLSGEREEIDEEHVLEALALRAARTALAV